MSKLAIKIFDNAIAGTYAIFKSSDNILEYKLILIGTPSANVKVFYSEQNAGFGGYFLQIYCANWNGAYIKLQCKSNSSESEYSDTGEIFTKDQLMFFKYN